MNVLLDTNVLCRLAHPGHVQHWAAREGIEVLRVLHASRDIETSFKDEA